jgi:uncharacterized membrane protein YphA (DoxX/SURF4 family)
VSPIRTIARPLMAVSFVTGGIDALRNPGQRPAMAAAAGLDNAEQLVKCNAAAMVVGGLALATGKLPRLSALVLAGTLVPTTYVGHPFWSQTDPAKKKQDQLHFYKNLGMLGGLLTAVADTGGRESLPHAAGRLTKRAQKKAAKASKKASKTTHSVVQSLPHVA